MKVATSVQLKKLTVSAMFLALCLALPFLTGQIPEIGQALSPMHIPVLLCGFVCGWKYGLVIGFIAPLLRFAMFSMPPIFPTGLAMAFELAAYGAAAGLLYSALPKKPASIYVSLISAMLIGRVCWGAVMFVLSFLGKTEFSLALFVSGAFVKAVPGIILHIVLIPLIVLALQKAKLMPGEAKKG